MSTLTKLLLFVKVNSYRSMARLSFLRVMVSNERSGSLSRDFNTMKRA